VWHLGRFEDYAKDYAGLVSVILTDPPYGKKNLPIYAALATFAQTVLEPGGWLLALCGNDEHNAVRNLWDATPLEYITDCSYAMLGRGGKGHRYTSVGPQNWQQHWKPILWYQQPGAKADHRRAGTTDTCMVEAPTGADIDQEQFVWQQSLNGFRKIVHSHTNRQDVICDPCMGSGTTLLAAHELARHRVIGIECDPETYAKACARLAPLLPADAQAGQAAD
jgi:predicted RNA methylase